MGTKYKENRHAGRQRLILCPKSSQEREQGINNAEVRVLPYRFCLEKQQLRSGQVPIKKQNWALLVFTWEASYHIMKEVGRIVSLYSLYISLIHSAFLKKNKSPTVMNLLKHIAFHKNRQIWLQTVKVTKKAWIGLRSLGKHHLLWKALGSCWGKVCQNALEKIKWPNHYKRSVCAIPSHLSMSCSWVLPCGGWTWGILKNCIQKTKPCTDLTLFPL